MNELRDLPQVIASMVSADRKHWLMLPKQVGGPPKCSRFRAFDAHTGKELWATTLEANAHATPITYMGKTGKQFVVIAAGGGGALSPKVSDTLVAFALPEQSARKRALH